MAHDFGSRLPRGFRDTLPSEMALRLHAVARLEAICGLYGFDRLDTPAVRHAEVLGSEDPDDEVFALEDTKRGRWLELRAELTPCLTRALSENSESINLPFRCYQFGTVWRRKTGRLDSRRALDTFDIDVVGVAASVPDAELCSLICDVLEGLGFERNEYHIRVFNRKVFIGLLELLGHTDPSRCWRRDGTLDPILTAMDAVRSHGPQEVRKMLIDGLPDSWGNLPVTPGLSDKGADVVLRFLETAGGNRMQVVSELRTQLQASTSAMAGLAELASMHDCLHALGIESAQVVYDPSFVRGPDRYESTTFEVVIDVDPNASGHSFLAGRERLRRAVAFGGRYSYFSLARNHREPAVGISFDLDRLMLRIPHEAADLTPPVIVTFLEPNQIEEYLKMTRDLRTAGVAAEIACVEGRFGKQLRYADRRGARLAVICGADEFAKGTVLIKDLRKGRDLSLTVRARDEWVRQSRAIQVPVRRDEMVTAVRELLDQAP